MFGHAQEQQKNIPGHAKEQQKNTSDLVIEYRFEPLTKKNYEFSEAMFTVPTFKYMEGGPRLAPTEVV